MSDVKMYSIVTALILVALYRIGISPDDTGGVAEAQTIRAEFASAPNGWREQFAIDLLHRLGNDLPSQRIVDFIVGWTKAEDGSDDAYMRNNPLNTTQIGFNETHTINGDGVKGYATYEDGLDATVQTLSYGNYTGIVYALQNNDPEGALSALVASPWAGSHYGGGFSY